MRAPCPKIDSCPLFPKFTRAWALEVWIDNYCRGDFEKCARFQMAAQGTRPADDMLPNGTRLAEISDEGVPVVESALTSTSRPLDKLSRRKPKPNFHPPRVRRTS